MAPKKASKEECKDTDVPEEEEEGTQEHTHTQEEEEGTGQRSSDSEDEDTSLSATKVSWPKSRTRKLSSRNHSAAARKTLRETPGFVPTDPKDGTYFEVPMWQRSYRWEKDNQERLAEDLLKRVCVRLGKVRNNLATEMELLKGNAERPHAMNTIVLFRPSPNEGLIQIVDGQQRLLTLAMMIAALHGPILRARESLRAAEGSQHAAQASLDAAEEPQDSDEMKTLKGLQRTIEAFLSFSAKEGMEKGIVKPRFQLEDGKATAALGNMLPRICTPETAEDGEEDPSIKELKSCFGRYQGRLKKFLQEQAPECDKSETVEAVRKVRRVLQHTLDVILHDTMFFTVTTNDLPMALSIFKSLNGPGSSSSLYPQELCKAFACAAMVGQLRAGSASSLVSKMRENKSTTKEFVDSWNGMNAYFVRGKDAYFVRARRAVGRDSSVDDFSIFLAAIASADAGRMIKPCVLFTHLEKGWHEDKEGGRGWVLDGNSVLQSCRTFLNHIRAAVQTHKMIYVGNCSLKDPDRPSFETILSQAHCLKGVLQWYNSLAKKGRDGTDACKFAFELTQYLHSLCIMTSFQKDIERAIRTCSWSMDIGM